MEEASSKRPVKADPLARGKDCSWQAVEEALERGLDPNVQWKELDMVEPRRTGGCVMPAYDPDFSWANYNTPLHKALRGGSRDAAALLLRSGARIDALNALGRTALLEAVARSDYDGVAFLLENGARVDAPTEERSFEDQYTERSGVAGIVPLQEAMHADDLRIVELLVEGGANLNQTSPGGWMVLDLAVLERNEPIVDLLQRRGARLSQQTTPDAESSPDLREQAGIMLAHAKMFPPSSCRGAYLHVLNHPEFLGSWAEYSSETSTTCRAVLDTFLAVLSRAAEKPNPENVFPGASSTCAACARFQSQFSPTDEIPFELHPDREALRRSARDAGCRLCALFEDALVHRSRGWAQRYEDSPPRNLPSAPSVRLVCHITKQLCLPMTTVCHNMKQLCLPTITVCCGEQYEVLEVYALSGKSMCPVPGKKAPCFLLTPSSSSRLLPDRPSEIPRRPSAGNRLAPRLRRRARLPAELPAPPPHLQQGPGREPRAAHARNRRRRRNEGALPTRSKRRPRAVRDALLLLGQQRQPPHDQGHTRGAQGGDPARRVPVDAARRRPGHKGTGLPLPLDRRPMHRAGRRG